MTKFLLPLHIFGKQIKGKIIWSNERTIGQVNAKQLLLHLHGLPAMQERRALQNPPAPHDRCNCLAFSEEGQTDAKPAAMQNNAVMQNKVAQWNGVKYQNFFCMLGRKMQCDAMHCNGEDFEHRPFCTSNCILFEMEVKVKWWTSKWCNAMQVMRVLHLHGLTAAAAGQAEPPPRLVHCLKGSGNKTSPDCN